MPKRRDGVLASYPPGHHPCSHTLAKQSPRLRCIDGYRVLVKRFLENIVHGWRTCLEHALLLPTQVADGVGKGQDARCHHCLASTKHGIHTRHKSARECTAVTAACERTYQTGPPPMRSAMQRTVMRRSDIQLGHCALVVLRFVDWRVFMQQRGWPCLATTSTPPCPVRHRRGMGPAVLLQSSCPAGPVSTTLSPVISNLSVLPSRLHRQPRVAAIKPMPLSGLAKGRRIWPAWVALDPAGREPHVAPLPAPILIRTIVKQQTHRGLDSAPRAKAVNLAQRPLGESSDEVLVTL